jgi:hypothetical protein
VPIACKNQSFRLAAAHAETTEKEQSALEGKSGRLDHRKNPHSLPTVSPHKTGAEVCFTTLPTSLAGQSTTPVSDWLLSI